MIYPVDSGIQSLNNRGQERSTYRLKSFVEYQKLNRWLFSKHVYRLKWTEWTSVWFVKRYLKLRSTELHSRTHWAYICFSPLINNVHLLTLAAVRFLATIIWRANIKSFVSHNTVHCSSCLLSNSWKRDTIFFFSAGIFSQADFLARFLFPSKSVCRIIYIFKSPIPSLKVKFRRILKTVLQLQFTDSRERHFV